MLFSFVAGRVPISTSKLTNFLDNYTSVLINTRVIALIFTPKSYLCPLLPARSMATKPTYRRAFAEAKSIYRASSCSRPIPLRGKIANSISFKRIIIKH